MKKLLLICMLSVATYGLYAQTLPQLSQIKLQKKKDYKVAEPIVLQTADYILSSPINQNKDSKTTAAQFLMNWMEGTPEYTFTLDENSTRSFLQNNSLMMVYVASMAKFAIQSKPNQSKAITINAIKTLLAYVNDPANNVQRDGNLQELSVANDKGQLESFLNL